MNTQALSQQITRKNRKHFSVNKSGTVVVCSIEWASHVEKQLLKHKVAFMITGNKREGTASFRISPYKISQLSNWLRTQERRFKETYRASYSTERPEGFIPKWERNPVAAS